MRQFAFVREHFPFGIEEQRDGDRQAEAKPRFQVLLKQFLRLQILGDDDQGPSGKVSPDERGDERARRWSDARKRKRSAMLQSPRQRLDSGSFYDIGEQMACRGMDRTLRQADRMSQSNAGASNANKSEKLLIKSNLKNDV